MLLFAESTEHQIRTLIKSPSHAVIVSGQYGAGKPTTARYIAQSLLGIPDLDTYAYFLNIQKDGKNVTIDQVRQIQSFLQLKTLGSKLIKRIVVIQDAETMSDEAQNALLKSLEEPPEDTVIILTATSVDGLKETIRSRAQVIQINRVSIVQAQTYFSATYSIDAVIRAHALSDGQMGLMTGLLDTKQEHPLVAQISLAKKLITSSYFERLTQVDVLSKDKASLVVLMYACKRICTSALELNAKKNDSDATLTWTKRLDAILRAESAVTTNANSKLALTDLFVHL